jgi:two-component system, NtrC family, sensor histidine kinase HydH
MPAGRKGKTFKISLVLGVILIISLLHYLTQRQERYYHLFYRELYFLPMILAGIWFGLQGAVLTSLFITALFLPMVFNEWQGFSVNDFDRILEIVLLNTISIILGLLSDREKTVLKSLQEAETLAALGSAVSGIVHDMKIPLVAIGGYARSLKRKLKEEDPNREKLDVIVRETNRLEELTQDILAYARPVPSNRVAGDLNKMVIECCRIANEMAKQKGVKIEIHPSPSRLTINFDPTAIERVLLNLISNAVQASPEGGAVTIGTVMEGRDAVITIADNGPGIPPEIREEIFSPFFTTKKEGTGLGLSIVLKIVKAHGGSITLAGNGEKGTIFKVSLPAGR